jgi:SEC-C motif-containing protein
MAADACPCGRLDARGRPLFLSQCCGPLHEGAPAPTAEHLMRSRYSAFVLGRVPYLLSSWHASTRPAELSLQEGKWLGLEVRRHVQTGPDTAEVEFVARHRVGGRAVRMHERSRFVREQGRWCYLDDQASDIPPA